MTIEEELIEAINDESNDAQNSDAARAENDRLKAVIQNTVQRLYSVEETARTYWDTHEQNNVKGIIKDLQDVL